jgi:hypothetical protein
MDSVDLVLTQEKRPKGFVKQEATAPSELEVKPGPSAMELKSGRQIVNSADAVTEPLPAGTSPTATEL